MTLIPFVCNSLSAFLYVAFYELLCVRLEDGVDLVEQIVERFFQRLALLGYLLLDVVLAKDRRRQHLKACAGNGAGPAPAPKGSVTFVTDLDVFSAEARPGRPTPIQRIGVPECARRCNLYLSPVDSCTWLTLPW